VVGFALIALSALVSRVQQPGLARPYRVPLWPLPPLLALAGVAVTVLVQTRRDLAVVAGILAAGVLYDVAYLCPRRDSHWILLDHSTASRTAATTSGQHARRAVDRNARRRRRPSRRVG
jgi:hypothetical protein